VLFTSLVVGLLGGWQSISVEIVEEEDAPAKPDESILPVYSRAA